MADTGLRKISAIPFPADLDYKKQTVQVPGTKRPGQTGVSLIQLVLDLPTDASSCVFLQLITETVRCLAASSSPSQPHS